jgi:DNA helicase HerA-like ATPase
MKAKFEEVVNGGYASSGISFDLGTGVIGGEVIKRAKVSIPLATLNRHGLVAGATGTGKTKTLQKLAELLSENGVPSLVMDMKGDFSGISQEGVLNDMVKARVEQIGYDWSPRAYPVEFLTLGEGAVAGVRMRATVSEFGPVLFSKMLELEGVQSSVMSLIFKYCDDMGLPLLDLNDIKQTLKYLQTDEGEAEISKEYGKVSVSTIGVILRKIIELEEQGA